MSLFQIFTVQLTLGEQVWEAEGTSIKKAQHSTAARALDESLLPRPAPRSPKVDINSNPGSPNPNKNKGKKLAMHIWKKGTVEVYGLISLSENGKHLHANLLVTEISTDSVAANSEQYYLRVMAQIQTCLCPVWLLYVLICNKLLIQRKYNHFIKKAGCTSAITAKAEEKNDNFTKKRVPTSTTSFADVSATKSYIMSNEWVDPNWQIVLL